MENWIDIPGYEGFYQISDFGRVKSLPRVRKTKGGGTSPVPERILKQTRDSYPFVGLHKNNKCKLLMVCDLVLRAFVGSRPSGMMCRHLDGNPSNNSLYNLCWASPKEVKSDAIKYGKVDIKGEKHWSKRSIKTTVLARQLSLDELRIQEGQEVWRDIKCYEGLYQISNYGRVRRLEAVVLVKKNRYGGSHKIRTAGRNLSLRTNPKLDYAQIILTKSGLPRTYSIHRLVALAFVSNTHGLRQVNHKDGNKKNNGATNLEWVTPKENAHHASEKGLLRTLPK